MLNDYNIFINNEIINEDFKIDEVKKSVSNIVNNAKHKLKVIKYGYYNEFTNDKEEIEEGGVYNALFRFEASDENEETEKIDNVLFLAQIQIKESISNDVKDNGDFKVLTYKYQIYNYGKSMVDHKDILDKYKNDIKLVKTDYSIMETINPLINKDIIHGFYLFKKDIDVNTLLSNNLHIDKTKIVGHIIGTKGKEKVGDIRSKFPQFGFYKNTSGEEILILYYKAEQVYYFNLTKNGIENKKHSDLVGKYRRVDIDNKPLTITTYVNKEISKIDNLDDSNKNKIIEKLFNVINLSLKSTKDESVRNSLLYLVKNIILEKYKVFIKSLIDNITHDASNAMKYKQTLNECLVNINNHIKEFNIDKDIVRTLNNLKNNINKSII